MTNGRRHMNTASVWHMNAASVWRPISHTGAACPAPPADHCGHLEHPRRGRDDPRRQEPEARNCHHLLRIHGGRFLHRHFPHFITGVYSSPCTAVWCESFITAEAHCTLYTPGNSADCLLRGEGAVARGDLIPNSCQNMVLFKCLGLGFVVGGCGGRHKIVEGGGKRMDYNGGWRRMVGDGGGWCQEGGPQGTGGAGFHRVVQTPGGMGHPVRCTSHPLHSGPRLSGCDWGLS